VKVKKIKGEKFRKKQVVKEGVKEGVKNGVKRG